jgi:hypothetical protein
MSKLRKYKIVTPGPILLIEANNLNEAKARAEANFKSIATKRGYSAKWERLSSPPRHIYRVFNSKGKQVTGCSLKADDK